MSDRPREFWIRTSNTKSGFSAWDKSLYDWECVKNIHSDSINVIEYSAYESLKRENEILKEALEHYAKTNGSTKAIQDSEIARQALSQIKERK